MVRDVLQGLDQLEVFEEIRGELDGEELLAQATVLCFHGDGYPRVDDHTGHILCPEEYTRTHDPLIVYLDILHELVHVRQVLQGQQVYHFPEPYVDWPTEIEAYAISYREAQRLGVSDAWFWDYLVVPWMEIEDMARLAGSIGLEVPEGALEPSDDREGARH